MKLKIKNCSNPLCTQTFGVWEKDPKKEHFCSQVCLARVKGGKTHWASEDRRATALKEKKKCQNLWNDEND